MTASADRYNVLMKYDDREPGLPGFGSGKRMVLVGGLDYLAAVNMVLREEKIPRPFPCVFYVYKII